ncbi:Zinc (Zn2)-Iron (Fe2) Permease [Phytophthora megakarya]|uniref:Zinc (Zn2)-Iron (Fe2) Permease n=1 Tax=Phytophthora megakarya TaxID=4795 RepID=A0A225WHF2_9STRA|nr:Zinc (Zn2)-Iron (Fe2) Permease [Phytophthora megakarya]
METLPITNIESLETLDIPVDDDLMKQRAGKATSDSTDSMSQKLQEEEVEKPLMGSSPSTRRYAYALAIAMIFITFYSFPMHHHFHGRGGKNARYVWWCGWLTAVATGIGALPFYWIRDLDKYWLGICNGLAAGMMIAATGCLFYEGWYLPQATDYGVSVTYRLFLGAFLGVLFIKFTKIFLEDYDDVTVCGLKGLDARKALLIMAVMTLHSVSEGIGVGVSFGGEGGIRRGHIVTMTMAIHNIPEGVAISLSLVPRGLSVFYAVLWCIMSSAPQPIFAVPAFLFVEQWLPILPCGLGFAGGAMAYVAVQELLPESLEDTKSVPTTVSATAFAFMVFLTIQIVLSGSL